MIITRSNRINSLDHLSTLKHPLSMASSTSKRPICSLIRLAESTKNRRSVPSVRRILINNFSRKYWRVCWWLKRVKIMTKKWQICLLKWWKVLNIIVIGCRRVPSIWTNLYRLKATKGKSHPPEKPLINRNNHNSARLVKWNAQMTAALIAEIRWLQKSTLATNLSHNLKGRKNRMMKKVKMTF